MFRPALIWLLAGAFWANLPVSACAQVSEVEEPSPLTSEESPLGHSWLDHYKAEFWDNVTCMKHDFRHMYTGKNLCYLGLTVAATYPIANTHADQGIRDWYQHHVKQPGYQDWTDLDADDAVALVRTEAGLDGG